MKANELMIDDWVRIKGEYLTSRSPYSQGHVRVQEILNVGINPFWIGAEVDDIIGFYMIEPIPITQEILEKNGWRSRMNGTGEFYLEEPLVDAAIVTKTITGFNMNHGPFLGLSIHYIHELQHALRLCKIEMEIIL